MKNKPQGNCDCGGGSAIMAHPPQRTRTADAWVTATTPQRLCGSFYEAALNAQLIERTIKTRLLETVISLIWLLRDTATSELCQIKTALASALHRYTASCNASTTSAKPVK